MDGVWGGVGCEVGFDFEVFGGGNVEYSVGEYGFEFVEGRFVEIDGDVVDDVGDGVVDVVVVVFEFGD